MKRVYQSSSSVPKLHLACLEGNAVEAKRFANPSNVKKKISVSPLFLACATGNYDLAKVLVDAGADVSEEPDLLLEAIWSLCDAATKYKLVELLLRSGVDVGHKRKNTSPLKAAISTGSIDLIELLMDAGAEVSAEPELLIKVIESPCENAAKCKLAELLLLKDADVNYKNANGHTPLDAAISGGCAEMIVLLIRGGGNIYAPEHGCFLRELLSGACRKGDFATIEALLDVVPKEHDCLSRSLLATIYGDGDDEVKTRVIKLLVAKGADVNAATGEEDVNPLDAACGYLGDGEWCSPKPQVVKVLTESGARADTALHTLCYTEYYSVGEISRFDADYEERLSHFNSIVIECVKTLLEHGAEVDITDGYGNAPLHLASREYGYPSPELVRFLCESGASVNMTRRDGRTALHILCAYSYDYLFNDEEEEELARFNNSAAECVKILLKHGAEVDISDDNGDEPFVLAVASGKHEVVELLLEHQKEHLPEYNEESGNKEESEDGEESESDEEFESDDESKNDEESEDMSDCGD